MPVVPVNINIPDPKPDPILRGLVKEFAAIARELRGLKPQDDHADMMKGMQQQQNSLLKTIERMMAMMVKMPRPQAQALDTKGLTTALEGVAEDFKDALKTIQAPKTAAPRVTVTPEVKVNLGGITKRLSSIEEAILHQMSRGRNRTFGSNY